MSEACLPMKNVESVQGLKERQRNQMCSHSIMFENGSIDVIVCWVTIDKFIEEECVEWHSPVGWTWSKCMIIPYAVVISNIDGTCVLVEVIIDILLVKSKCR
jgi:hypothetical protein